MQQEQIIPTRHRAKIPQALSYPIGAKAISEALIGVPQFDQLSIAFRFGKKLFLQTAAGTWLPTYQMPQFGHIAPSNRYCVLQAQFSGPFRIFSASKLMNEKGYCSPSWTIRVVAAPRSLRHLIQDKIVAEALPPIRSWLLSNAHSSEREGVHGLVFIFAEAENELTCEEHASVVWQTVKAD
jgi:hypothetical protein